MLVYFVREVLLNPPNNVYELYNLPGESLDVAKLVEFINAECGEELISYEENAYPFAKGVSNKKFLKDFPQCSVSLFKNILNNL